MLAIVNFVAVFVVSAVVAYQIYETINKYKDISNKLTTLEKEDASTKAALFKTTKDLTTSIDDTSSKLNDKLNATEQQFNERIENTHNFVTSELQTTNDDFNTRINETKDDLDVFFTNLSKQVVTENTKTKTLNLGDKFRLSGVDKDEWLRLMDKDGKNYYGGFATNRLWVGDKSDINNDVNVFNGKVNFIKTDPGAMVEKSYDNPGDRYGIGQFPGGAMRMYASGVHRPATTGFAVTKQNGTLDDVLTVSTDRMTNVYGDMDLNGKLFFGRNDGSSDPYMIEKKKLAPNRSALRVTVNDDADEAVEIWGDSCSTGNCAGEGVLRHKFQANGDASHDGNLQVKNRLWVNRTPNDKFAQGWGSGIHTWDVYANGSIGVGTNGMVSAAMDNAGKVQAKQVCIDSECLNADQLKAIKAQAKVL